MRYFICLLTVVFIFTAHFVHAEPVVCGENLTDNGNDTVTDSATGLTWKKCFEGQTGSSCTGTATTYTWPNALALTENGWRVPNIKELQSIVDVTRINPAINIICFPTPEGETSIQVWSSSHHAGTPANSWTIDFKDGKLYNILPQNNFAFVRLVKDAQ